MTPDTGDVARLTDWPGIKAGRRYYISAIQTVMHSEYPEQADIYMIELMPNVKYPRGRLGAGRTVPLDRLIRDPKRSNAMRAARGEVRA